MMTDREKQISDMIDSIMPEKEWKNKRIKKVEEILKTYEKELDKYIWVEDIDEYDNIKVGGYIRYVNFSDEFKWGGILIRKSMNVEGNHIMHLKNSSEQYFNILYERNYIFYRQIVTRNDKLRDLFISYIDMDKYK